MNLQIDQNQEFYVSLPLHEVDLIAFC